MHLHVWATWLLESWVTLEAERRKRACTPGRHISVSGSLDGVSGAGVERRKEDLETMSERSLEARMYGLSWKL